MPLPVSELPAILGVVGQDTSLSLLSIPMALAPGVQVSLFL